MKRVAALLFALLAFANAPALAEELDARRDILVTFEDSGARAASSGASAPYRNRKRYTISPAARRDSRAVASEYGLTEIDDWPIRHLDVYCFVYRIPEGASRESLLERLRADTRVESAQELNEFDTSVTSQIDYDDTYADLQHGLATLDIDKAHRHSRGRGVRIAIIDSAADLSHEDLEGRIRRVGQFADKKATPHESHGTAVTSVIGAVANNAKGIVGIAPEATVDLFVACWSASDSETAICDSFTLAKALDTLLDDPPDILNLSLVGPRDALLERLLRHAHKNGVVIVAACASNGGTASDFPASMVEVIGVASSGPQDQAAAPANVFAPGDRILVAIPDDAYDFRSGSSLAAAHVTGVIALLLDVLPGAESRQIQSLLRRSQHRDDDAVTSVNACKALHLADPALACDS